MNRLEEKLLKLDYKKWTNNMLVFFAPLIVLYLLFVQANVQSDGFQVSDFTPTSEVIGGMILYTINVLMDFLRKFKAA